MEEKKIETARGALHYYVYGSGEAVMLIHGFGEDGRVWRGLAEQLSKRFRVIVPDLPGSGRSTAAFEEPSIVALARAVGTVADSEHLHDFSMIGHSMGGYITLAFAAANPGRLRKLGLFHSTSFPDSEDKKVTRKRNIDFIRSHGARKFLEQSVPTLFSPETNEKNPALVRDTISQYSNFSADSLVLYTEAMMNRPPTTDVLSAFPGPVLFICGEHDKAVPLEQSLKECHLPGNSYIYVCTHSAHSGMLEEPEFCTEAVTYFLSGT